MSKRWMFSAAMLGAVIMLVWGDFAHAAEPGSASMILAQGPMLGVVMVLGLLAAASLLAYLSPGVLGRRLGIVSGAHYVALGALLVPITGALGERSVAVLEPMMALIVGAVALGAGLKFSPAHRREIGVADLKLGAVISGVGALVMIGLPLTLLILLADQTLSGPWSLGVAALGVLALSADDGHLRGLTHCFGVQSPSAERAARLTGVCAMAALLALLIVFMVSNPHTLGLPSPLEPLVGLGLHLGLGTLAGGLAGALIQGRPDDDRMITIVLGVGVALSATAYATSLSVVVVNVIAGVVMASMSSESLRLTKLMEGWGAPLYVLTLFFAGTLWAGGNSPWVWGAALGFVLLRYIGRMFGVLAYRPRLRGLRPEPGTHRALWAPGALGAAMVIDLAGALQGVASANLMISALVLSLLLADLLSYVLLRGWLIDISDVDAERRAHSPWGGWQEAR